MGDSFKMLENLLKASGKVILPLVFLANTAFPSKPPYVSFVNYNQKDYLVEIDKDRKLGQVDAKNDFIAKQVGMRALVNQKMEEVNLHINDLNYETLETIFGPIDRSKEITNKINLIISKFGVKMEMPWFFFMVYEYLERAGKYNKEAIAAPVKAFRYGYSARKLLDRMQYRDNPESNYRDLCLVDDNLEAMIAYIKGMDDSSKIKSIIKNDEIKFAFDEFWRTLNLDKMENEINDIIKRCDLDTEKVSVIKKDLETTLEESRDYQQTMKNLKERDLSEIIKPVKFILSKAENLFEGKYTVPLYTSSNPEFQTPGCQEKAELKIKVEKSLLKGKDFNLRVWILSDRAINKTQTDFFIFNPKKTNLGKISQKAFNATYGGKSWEEILPYGKDKSIVMQLELVKSSFDEAIRKSMKGYIIKTRNVLGYFGEKIYEETLEKGEENMERHLAQLGKDYESHQIKINPSKGFRQTEGYLIVLPVENSENIALLIYSNIGVQSSRLPNEKGFSAPQGYEYAFGRLENLIINLKRYGDENELNKMEEEWANMHLYWCGVNGGIESASFERISENFVLGKLTTVSRYKGWKDQEKGEYYYDCNKEEISVLYKKGQSWKDYEMKSKEIKVIEKYREDNLKLSP